MGIVLHYLQVALPGVLATAGADMLRCSRARREGVGWSCIMQGGRHSRLLNSGRNGGLRRKWAYSALGSAALGRGQGWVLLVISACYTCRSQQAGLKRLERDTN